LKGAAPSVLIIKIRAKKGEPFHITRGEDVLGHRIQWEILKNSYGSPGNKCTGLLRYGIGMDNIAENIQIGIDLGIIERSGNWYKISFHDKQFNGTETMRDFLDNDNEAYNKLIKSIKEVLI